MWFWPCIVVNMWKFHKNLQNYFYSTKYHTQQPLYNTLELLMMGIVMPETCWASSKIAIKPLLHLVGILFPHTIRHFGVCNTMECHTLVCTSMLWYAPVCTEVLWSTKFSTLRESGMHWYAPVCLRKLRSGHSSVKMLKFLNTGYKNHNCISKSFHIRKILRYCDICNVVSDDHSVINTLDWQRLTRRSVRYCQKYAEREQ